MVKQLGGKGNVIYLGGIAGGEVGLGELAGMVSVFDKNPGINLLTGKKSFPATNWDPAQTTKIMSGLLPKYPKIDGIVVDNGNGAAAVVRVLKAAGRKVPPIAALEANEAGCLWKDEKGSFDLATTSARNWMGRIAVRKAVAAVNGIDYKEKSIIPLPLFEDSTGTNKPQCDPSKGPDALLSNNLPTAELNKLSGAPATLK
jgi:ribose transport system substrate-binding protein